MNPQNVQDSVFKQIFQLLELKTKSSKGLSFNDAQNLVNKYDFIQAIEYFKNLGYHIFLSPKTERYFLITKEPDARYKAEQKRKNTIRENLTKKQFAVDLFERKRTNGKAATCPICDANHQELNRGNQHDR